jgi:hypothetical protein
MYRTGNRYERNHNKGRNTQACIRVSRLAMATWAYPWRKYATLSFTKYPARLGIFVVPFLLHHHHLDDDDDDDDDDGCDDDGANSAG